MKMPSAVQMIKEEEEGEEHEDIAMMTKEPFMTMMMSIETTMLPMSVMLITMKTPMMKAMDPLMEDDNI